MVVSFAFLYNFWVIIFRFSFAEITRDNLLIWFSLDYLMDLIYLLDIIFHFRTGYLEDGVLQTDSTKLRQHYMNSTTFYVDWLCLLPLDFLYLSLGFKSILRIFRYVLTYYKTEQRMYCEDKELLNTTASTDLIRRVCPTLPQP